MNKKEILAVVYKMLEQYKAVTEEFLESMDLRSINFINGFCVWLHNRAFPLNDYGSILDELIKDVPKKDYRIQSVSYWYETYKNTQSMENSIVPRIAHLERTIARLEKEIINDTPAII